nr:FAR1 DNA binding domain-containing protein [Tanacetum cinerariifolium]
MPQNKDSLYEDILGVKAPPRISIKNPKKCPNKGHRRFKVRLKKVKQKRRQELTEKFLSDNVNVLRKSDEDEEVNESEKDNGIDEYDDVEEDDELDEDDANDDYDEDEDDA